MSFRAGSLVALAAVASLSAAQAQAPAPQITGVVRDAITRAPLAGARVRLAAYQPEWCDACPELSGIANVTTDRQGQFTFAYAYETFVLEADQTGYARGGFGVCRPSGRPARIDLKQGQRLVDVEILLFREAVIRGRVTDDVGKPMPDFEVSLARVDADGLWQYPSRGLEGEATPATTDAQGYYTAYAAPGRYAVTVLRNLIPTFHPAATSIHEATLVTLKPGEVRDGIDVRLRPNLTAVVEARVAVPPGPPVPNLYADVSLQDGAVRIEGQYRGGNFAFANVPYGNYTLTAEFRDFRANGGASPWPLERWAQVPVRVDREHIGPIDLVPQPSLRVSGTVTTPAGRENLMPGIQLEPADADEIPCGIFRWNSFVTKDAQFLLRASPGRYRLCVWMSSRTGWEEATLNGRDVLDQPFTLTQDTGDLRIVVSPTQGRLHGIVQDSNDRPVREGWVVVFPVDRSSWPYAVRKSGHFASVRVSIAGAFEINTMLSGQYVVAAVDDASMEGWPNEAWMAEAARGAQTVTLGLGETREIPALRLRSIPPGPAARPRTSVSRVSLFQLSMIAATRDPNAIVSVEGMVRDSSGRPAVRAQVTASRADDFAGPDPVFTGLDGRYRIGNLRRGATYTLTAEADVAFRDQSVLTGSDPSPMVVTELAEIEIAIERSRVIDLRLSPTRRPSFDGRWTLDEKSSYAARVSLGLDELGPPEAKLSVDHRAETINWSRGIELDGRFYRTNGSSEDFTIGGRDVTAISRWQGERLVTRLTVAASADRPARTYEETRWIEKNKTMVVEIRGEDGSLLRRSVYK